MPLNDVLNFWSGQEDDDPAPITAGMLKNISRILLDGDPATGEYDVDNILTSMIYALRALELELAATKKAHGSSLELHREQLRALES